MNLPKKILAIDIGNERIKMVHTQRISNKIKLLNSAIIDTPPASIEDGSILDGERIGAAIREALTKQAIREKNTVFTISGNKILSREIEMPYVKPNKLREIIQLNAQEHFPVDLTDYTIDYLVLNTLTEDNTKKLLINMVAAQNDLLAGYVGLANQLGLKLLSIDYAGVSVTNFINHEQIKGTNLFLDIGSDSTMVTIISNNSIKFNRSLVFGIKDLIEKVSQLENISYQQALERLTIHDRISELETKFSDQDNQILESLEQVVGGVSRLVDYYSSRNQKPLDGIFLFGGGANIQGLEKYIERYFNISTHRFDRFDYIITDTIDSESIVSLLNAIGASISKLNLLPKAVKDKDRIASKKRIPVLLGILGLTLLGGLYYMQYAKLVDLEHRRAAINQEMEELSDITQLKTEYQELLTNYEFSTKLAGFTDRRGDRMVDIIKHLHQTMPQNSFITEFANTEQTLVLAYKTDTVDTMANVLTYLKKLTTTDADGQVKPLFVDVFTSAVDKVGEDGSRYVESTIVCTYYGEEVANAN